MPVYALVFAFGTYLFILFCMQSVHLKYLLKHFILQCFATISAVVKTQSKQEMHCGYEVETLLNRV